MTASCPCCGHFNIRALLKTPDMPVNSCILRWSKDASLKFPRRSMDLAICETCGFFWNTTFDNRLLVYDSEYESTQTHSEYFRGYLENLARDWLRNLDKVPQNILEVGCGQGEFLAALSEITDANLLGFDPAYRLTTANPAQIIPEALPEKPTATFDLVVNRMTLEHIAEPRNFLTRLSKWVAPGGTLITQVPNAEQIIAQEHVIELFYEHVNYFTTKSLLHALKRIGFRDNRTEITYGRQHLTICSRREPSDTDSSAPASHDFGNSLAESMKRFTEYWNRTLENRRAEGRDVWIWGTGSRATTFLSLLSVEGFLSGAIDINPMREGSYVLGTACKTFMPQTLRNCRDLSIVVMNPIYNEEIAKMLDALSAEAELLLVNDF